MRTHCLIFTLLVCILLISGCTSSRTYEQPEKISNTFDTTNVNEANPTTPSVQIFNVGDTATDGELKVTLNIARFTKVIDDQDNEFLIAEASPGKLYAIVDITVENLLEDKTKATSALLYTKVIDGDGYAYDMDLKSSAALDKRFSDGDLLPGMKRRGRISFEVPETANELKFTYKFGLFGTTAVFKLK